MSEQTSAWDPPLTDTDAEQIVAALDRQRATFRWKADGLGPEGLTQRIGASELTLGGLLNHLTFVEDLYSTLRLDDSALDAVGHDAHPGGVGGALPPDGLPRRPTTTTTRPSTTRSAGPTCGACCSTCSRSTAATRARPTCCAKPSTNAPARTRRPTGARPGSEETQTSRTRAIGTPAR